MHTARLGADTRARTACGPASGNHASMGLGNQLVPVVLTVERRAVAEQKEEDFEFAPGEAGWTFRAEMATTNFLMGYWKHLVAVLVVGLLCVLFYGQYQAYVQRTQRSVAARIAEVERGLPTQLIDLPRAQQMGEPVVDAGVVTGAADQMEAVARDSSGPGAVEAWLKAAELHRLAGQPDRQRQALEHAADLGTGVLQYAAVAALANLDLEQDRGDDGVARLRSLLDTHDGYLGQRAALDLGLALEHVGRGAEARETYALFLQRWPDSAQADEVRQRSSRLGGEG